MRPALLLPVLLLGCSQPSSPHTGTVAEPPPSPPAARPAAAPAGSGAVRITAEQVGCVEKWLAGHGLDTVGNAQGTMYAGGSPTFDEKAGTTVDRWALVAKNRPEALQFCHVPLGP